VYVAQRTTTATRQLIRLRYDTSSSGAEVSLFTASVAERAPSSVRALLPAMVVVGRLEPIANEAVA
ncbi:MAG: hypothetical protein ACREPM_07000, partial [Gemmatimonadaceae bacterium]